MPDSDPSETLDLGIKAAEPADPVEEQQALASIEAMMFARDREPFRFARYVITRKLGSGGAGVVYQGYDPELDRRVAIKVLQPAKKLRWKNSVARERFVREARVVAKFSHPNVIAVHDVGTFDGTDVVAHLDESDPGNVDEGPGVFIVMEMVEGADLHHWLSSRKRSWREILGVFMPAGEGLAAAHQAGIVHRDFKPGNVLVGEDGRVKVADFGLALSVGSRTSSGNDSLASDSTGSRPKSLSLDTEVTENGERLTRTGTVLGTPAYMSPEQHRGEDADEKTDQYAFCVALFRALYGRLPFPGDSWTALYNDKIDDRVTVPPRATIPQWLRRVVCRGLRARPGERHADMPALLAALRADPARRARRAMRTAALPVGLAGLAWAGFFAVQPGTLQLEVTAGGAPLAHYALKIDGKDIASGEDGNIDLRPGSRFIEVEAAEHERAVHLVEIERGSTHEVVIDLRHEQATLDLDVEPRGGTILIDGVDHGSRLKGFSLDTGHHEIEVRHEGYYDVRFPLDVSRDSHTDEFVALRQAVVWSQPRTGVNSEFAWVGDLDGDGFGDLVHQSFGTLSLYDPWAGEPLWSMDVPMEAVVRFADFDGDGNSEIVVATWTEAETTVTAFSDLAAPNRLEKLWSRKLGEPTQTNFEAGDVALGDLDGDGRDDVLIAAGQPARVIGVRGHDGHRLFETQTRDPAVSAIVVDDPDGPRAYVLGARFLSAFDPETGTPVWQTKVRVTPRAGETDPPDAYELDWLGRVGQRRTRMLRTIDRGASERADVLIQERRSQAPRIRLRAFRGDDGAPRWSVDADPEHVGVGPDLDADGIADVVTRAAGDRSHYRFHSGATGRAKWSAQLAGTVRVLDWDGSPAIMHYDAGRGRLLDPSNGRVQLEKDLGKQLDIHPVLVDWNADGESELIATSADGTIMFLDRKLGQLASALLPVIPERIAASRDADRDGFPDLLVEAKGPMVIRGPKVRWWRRATDAIRGAPIAHDVDQDGTPELALNAEFDHQAGFFVLDAKTGGFEVGPREDPGGNAIRGPVLFPRPDGKFDFVSQSAARVIRFRAEDAAILSSQSTGQSYTRPGVADVDSDGHAEVFVVAWDSPGMLTVIDGKSFEVERDLPLPDGGWGQPTIADFDGDGTPEVAATTHDGHVTVYDTSTWTERWTTATGGRLAFSVTPLPRRDDEVTDVLVSPRNATSTLIALDGKTGQVRWRINGKGSGRGRPVAEDIDGDAQVDIFVAGLDGGVRRFTASGDLIWEKTVVSVDGSKPGASGPAALADLDGNGQPYLLTGWEDGTLRVFDASTGALAWVFHTGGEIEAAPISADIDNDGKPEVIVASHDRYLYCVDHRAP